MKGDPLPHSDEVSRYCKPSWVHKGELTVAAFEIAGGVSHLSVNWLQYFVRMGATDRVSQLDSIREAFVAKGYELRANGRFAVLNVGRVARTVALEINREIEVLHWPEDEDDSHSGIFGYGPDDLAVALELKNLLRAEDVFAAVPPQ